MQYTYDPAGNRIKKEIDLNPGQPRKPSPISDAVGEQTISIYPNPTTEKVNIKLSELDEENTFMRVVDLNGRLIYEQQILQTVNEVNFSNQASGKYIIQLINGEEKVIG